MKPEEALEIIDDTFLHKMEDEVNFDIKYNSHLNYLDVNIFGEFGDSWSSYGGTLLFNYLSRKYPDPEVRRNNLNGWWYFRVSLEFNDSERGELKMYHEKYDIYSERYRTKRERLIVNNLKDIVQILNSQDIIYLGSSANTQNMSNNQYSKSFLIIFCIRDLEDISIKRFSEFNK